ncbi:chromodomain-helicase-DNA-binding protein 7-like [Ipomoea triloba]|nr:chromodomain-helicase-DNA-binding protein 7-like [Ipomoea triloba]
MTSKPPNYLKRKADELEAALRKEQKKSQSKSSKSSVGQGEPEMAKGHGSEGSTHQPKTQPEPSKPKASKHAESSKRIESSFEEEPEKSSKKRKARSLEAAQKKKSKKDKSKRSKGSDEKDLTEVSKGRETEGKQAESSHEEEAKASKEVTKKRKAKQLKRPKKKQRTDQFDEVEVEHETQSTAVLPAEEEPREAQFEDCHRVFPPPLDLSREDSDEEDQMPLTRLLKPTTPQIESPSVTSFLESLPPPEPLITESESPIAPMPRTQQLVITLPRKRNESGSESTMIEDESEGDDAEVCDQSYRPMSAIVQRQITEHLSPSMARIMLTLDYIHRHHLLQWPRVSTIPIEEIPPTTTESEIPESAQQLILHSNSC